MKSDWLEYYMYSITWLSKHATWHIIDNTSFLIKNDGWLTDSPVGHVS